MSEDQSPQKPEHLFSVVAEVQGIDKALHMMNLGFARLMDDIVVPCESKQPFFIDGVPVKREQLRKLKIVKQSDFFSTLLGKLHYGIRWGDLKRQQLYAEQYDVRLEALLRESGEDVTSQVIQAFDRTIKPRLKDYLPKREELISAALTVFVESIKKLAT